MWLSGALVCATFAYSWLISPDNCDKNAAAGMLVRHVPALLVLTFGLFVLWWHPGSSYLREDEPSILRAFRQADFRCAVFLKGDYTRFPPELRAWLEDHYVRDDAAPHLTVYRRR